MFILDWIGSFCTAIFRFDNLLQCSELVDLWMDVFLKIRILLFKT